MKQNKNTGKSRADKRADRRRRLIAIFVGFFAILLAAAMIIAYVPGMYACSESTLSAPTKSMPSASPQSVVVPSPSGAPDAAIFMPTKSLSRYEMDFNYIQAGLEHKGYKVDLLYGGENDVDTQISQIENEIPKGPKVMVIASIDPSSLVPVLEKVASAGIKVIAYGRLPVNTPNVDYFAGFDASRIGTLQGDYIRDQLKLDTAAGPFNIELFAGSPDDSNAKLFFQSAIGVLQPYIDNGKLLVLSDQTALNAISIGQWKSENAQKRMGSLLSTYYKKAKLDAILSPNDSLAIGIIAALDEAGYGKPGKPYPILTGQDCDKANVKAILAGKQSMSVFSDTNALEYKIADMVDALLQGKEVPVNATTSINNGTKTIPAFLYPPVVVDQDNYKQVLIDSKYYTMVDIS